LGFYYSNKSNKCSILERRIDMKSFISWISGKNYLKKVITEQMPNKFNRYIEVFGGAG